ncbi:MAG: cadherin-like domain-containing protein [Nitrospirae bacterium]|nr:cadherin-like domain-containing protein [Nitrospirota bacterium]
MVVSIDSHSRPLSISTSFLFFLFLLSLGCGQTDPLSSIGVVAVNDSVTVAKNSTSNVINVLANDTDLEGNPLTVTAVTAPTSGTAAVGVGGANVTYTPSANFTGTDSFTYTISDGSGGTATATVVVTVGNTAPTASNQSVTTAEDTAMVIALSGSDSNGDPLTFTVTSPTQGSLDTLTPPATCNAGNCTAQVIYTPSLHYNGSDSFTFKANDGLVDSTVATVSITVTPATIERVNVDPIGAQAQGPPCSDPFTCSSVASYSPSISSTGRYVAYSSFDTTLVAGDTNDAQDVFVRDRQTNTTSRVSVASDGTEADDNSDRPAISADGRYVAFMSNATNLVTGDTNLASDIFVYDRQTGVATRVSIVSDGTEANGGSYYPAISADGRYVAFMSNATNLVTGDTNLASDIFVHDRQTNTTTRVSVDSTDTQANGSSAFPTISSDGRYVAFRSYASNLITGDTNSTSDIFVHNLQTGITVRMSIASDGTEGNNLSYGTPSMSADGRYVAFESDATNLVAGDTNGASDIFVHDRDMDGDGVYDEAGAVSTTRVSVASDGAAASGGSSFSASISGDGRYVAFMSIAINLVAGDTNGFSDIFVHDRDADGNGIFDESGAISTTRVSVASDGTEADDNSRLPSINADGRYAAFESDASTLVTGDTNTRSDIFVDPVP